MNYQVVSLPDREIVATFHGREGFNACLQAKRLAWSLREQGGEFVVMEDKGLPTADEPWTVEEILQREG